MKIYQVTKIKCARRAVLFFCGFACGENFAKCLPNFSRDVFIICDYRKMGISEALKVSRRYEKVDVVGWSFGVWAAAKFCAMAKNVGRKIAICGSPIPVSDDFGIPVRIFKKTVENFDSQARTKFYRRVCGGVNGTEFLCGRSASELKSELIRFSAVFSSSDYKSFEFDHSIASKDDKIFPIENLKKFFGKGLEQIEGEHFNTKALSRAAEVIEGVSRVKLGFDKNAETYLTEAKAQAKIADRLAQLIANENLDFARGGKILEIGCGSGFLTRALSGIFRQPLQIFLNDLSYNLCALSSLFWKGKTEIVDGDFISIDFGRKKFDAIFSSSSLHWFENQERLFSKIAKLTKSGGVLAFASFGKGNLAEVESAMSGKSEDFRFLKYCTSLEVCEILRALNFNVKIVREEKIVMLFDKPIDVLRHLKATGVNSKFSRFWTKGSLAEFSAKYPKDNSGKFALTYAPFYIYAKKL